MAVRAQYADVVKDEQGRPIAGASIAVYQVGTTTAIAETIYADATGAGTLSNPLTADSAGRFQFYLDQPKRVDLYVSKTGYTAYTLEDADVICVNTRTVLKTTNEVVNNSTTYQLDDEIKLYIGANEIWAFTIVLRWTSSAVANIKFAWNAPAGALIRWRVAGGAASDDKDQTEEVVGTGTGAALICELVGTWVNSTVAGTFFLRWAQNTAEATDTTIWGNSSYLIAHRLA